MLTNITDFVPVFFLRDFLIGIFGLTIILLFHGACLLRLVHRFERLEAKLTKKGHFYQVLLNFYLTFVTIAMVHIAEITLWAVGILSLGLMESATDALIFSGSCYTTVGFVEDLMPNGWKFLAFFISFSGLFTLAWTTSSMVEIIGAYKESWKKLQAAKRNNNSF